MELITYRGEIAAVAGATRAYLAPHIEALDDHDPVKQFVLELCLHAHRLAEGALEGEPPEYLPGRAERHVREQRMPADVFRPLTHLPDEQLAEAFNVPVWEVAIRRRELETLARPGRALARRRAWGRSQRRPALCLGVRPRSSP